MSVMQSCLLFSAATGGYKSYLVNMGAAGNIGEQKGSKSRLQRRGYGFLNIYENMFEKQKNIYFIEIGVDRDILSGYKSC